MARYSIYSKNGSTVRYSGAPVYHGTHLKPAYLEFREIASPTVINWQIGDYVDYDRTGFRYKLYNLPYPTKQATPNSVGDAFVYKDVQFFCATKDLEICPFRDLVISDNTIHFTTLPDVATYEDVFGIARRIQANLDAFYGEGVWNIRVFDTSDADLRATMLETKDFSLSDGNCLDALSQIYSQWKGIGWVYSVENGVNTITIGRPNVQDRDNTTSIFAYGIGNGLTLIKKEQSGKNELATRLYAYGSTRNLIARYYNNLTPPIKDNQSVYIPNLMIPVSEWGETDDKKDARKAYLEADEEIVAKYGLRPKTIYFDGTGDYEEIYPSIEGLTAGQLRAAMQSTDDYYPSATFAADSQRLDEVVAAENPSDDGVLSTDDGGKYVQTVNLLGVSQSNTYHFNKGQESAKIPLEEIVVANTITAKGKVVVTPSFTAVINSGVTMGALSVRLWIEINGVKYGNPACKYVRGVGNNYTITLEPFEINTEDVGSVLMKGYIFAAPASKDSSFDFEYGISMGTTKLEVELQPTDTFKVQIRQIGFDISKQQSAISDGLCTIAFKSGWCAGREFTVKRCEYIAANDRWQLTVVRQNDESIGQYFPNSIYRIEEGDRFVLTDLTMPEVYITSASQRLLARAQEVLDALSTPKIVYEPEIDAKVLAQSPEKIMEGMYMPVQDDDVIEDVVNIRGVDFHRAWILIDTVEINEGEEAIPTYKVTLQDEKRESFLSSISRQTGHNTRNITDIELRDLRNEVEELTPSTTEPEEISVSVVASHPIIGYENSFDDEPVNEVVLTCQTTGIDNPSYQWYYLGAITWVAITGATGQSYKVDPDSLQYFRNGEIVEDFRCVVNDNPDLSASVQIMKVLANAISVSLSNPAHIFAAGVQYAEEATDRTDVLGYKGVERFATKVKMTAIRFLDSARTPLTAAYTGGRLKTSNGEDLTDSQGRYLTVASGNGANLVDTYTGDTMLIVKVVDNNTTSTYLTIEATDKMNIPAGVIEIPIIIRDADAAAGITEKVVNLYYSWSLALQGNTSFTSVVFTRTNGTPEAIADDDGDFDNPVPQDTYTDSAGNSYTWSDSVPSGDATLWMAMRVFSANGYYPQDEHWSTPSPAFDTADLDFEYSALATDPGTPSNPATGANWHNTATSSDIWMAMRKKTAGVWGAWEVFKVKGEKGDSPLFADINNEMDGLSVGPDGILQVSGGVTLATKVSMWYGENAQTITGIVPTVNHLSSNIHVSFPNGYAAGDVQILVDNGTDFNTYDKIEISLLVTCSLGSRTVVFTLLAIKDGEDGVVYVLQPSADTIKGSRAADNSITYSPTRISCSRMARKGSGSLASSSVGVLKMSVDGGSTKKAYSAISSSDTDWASLIAAGKIIYYWFTDNAETSLIDRETIPVVIDGAKGADGDNGYSASTVYLYCRRSNGTTGLSVPQSNYKYRFANGKIYAANDTQFQNPLSTIETNWHTEIPSGDDPCYVTMAFVQANEATATLTGGLNTAGGSWSPITRLTGDNGLRGKIMRGINEFSSSGLSGGRPDGTTAGYQGMDETLTSVIYYDVVYRVVNGTRKYYYCKLGVNGSYKAQDFTPDYTTGWETYWEEATNFNFIATKVLLASNAFIDVFSGNAAYMYDDGQTYIVAGMQGGSTTASGSSTVPQVNFFAGTTLADQNPLNAPFRVTYQGVVFCKDIRISGGEIQISNGNAVVFSVSNTGALVAANATITGGSISIKNASNVEVFKVTTTGKLIASDVEITGAVKASGNNYSDGEGGSGMVAMWSENGFRMSDGAAFFHGVGIASYGEKSNTDIAQIIQSKKGNKVAGLHSGANTYGAIAKMDASSSDSGDGDAEVSVSTAGYGFAHIKAAKDANNYVLIEFLGTTSDAIITRKVGGNGSSENLISGNCKHIQICEHGQVPAVGSRDANTLYFEKKA